jgi:hypothetical protein
MVLDAQTLKDLEIFEAETDGTSLFDLCDFTRNLQGARALKNRMQRPWSNPDRIRNVQDSLLFIQENRKAFNNLPTFVTTELVENYFTRSLPLITSSNIIEFLYHLLEIRFGDYGRYTWIQRGIGATASLIHKLRSIVESPEFASPQGELATYITEMRTLLDRPSLEAVSDEAGVWAHGKS